MFKPFGVLTIEVRYHIIITKVCRFNSGAGDGLQNCNSDLVHQLGLGYDADKH